MFNDKNYIYIYKKKTNPGQEYPLLSELLPRLRLELDEEKHHQGKCTSLSQIRVFNLFH